MPTNGRLLFRAIHARVVGMAVVMSCAPLAASAQCVGDLTQELTALDAVARLVVERVYAPQAGGGAPAPTWDRFTTTLRDDGIYLNALADAGTSAQCLLDKREAYRNSAEAALLRLTPDKNLSNKQDQVRAALHAGAASALSTRYAPSDRFGVFFGFGSSLIHHADDAVRYKVISRRNVNGDTSTHQYIVEETTSRSLPIATTGLAIRFRDRNATATCGPQLGLSERWMRSCGYWLLDRMWPTTLFGALQFGGGAGTVSGTTLGVGWKVVGDVNLLFGYGITRLPTLRRDVYRAFAADTSGLLRLPDGESEESIMGTESQQAFTITLGIPLSLRNALGR